MRDPKPCVGFLFRCYSDPDYGGLEVKDGGSAQQAYLEAISLAPSDLRRQAVEGALLAYCKRDTEAMVVLLKRLCQE